MQSSEAPESTRKNSDLAETVVRERSRLRNFIRRSIRDPMEAEDLLQDVFQELVEAYRLPEPIEQAGAWLFRVARNRIIDRFRKNNHRAPAEPHKEDRLDLELPGFNQGPDAFYARSIALQAIQLALDDLPPDQREVFVEHEIEGASFKQLAARSGTPLNTLLARKRSAVLYLRKRLQTIYDDLEI